MCKILLSVIGLLLATQVYAQESALQHLAQDPTNVEVALAAAQTGPAGPGTEQQYLPKALRILPQASVSVQASLAAGPAVKIAVRQTGWYRVAAAQLVAAGLAVGADARFLQLYAEGTEFPLAVNGGEAARLGANGYIEFYGIAADTLESDTRIYWLVTGTRPGLRFGPPANVAPHGRDLAGQTVISHLESGIPVSETPNARYQIANSAFRYTVERRERRFYFPSIRNGPENSLFGAPITSSQSPSQVVRVTQMDPTASETARISITLQGASAAQHNVQVKLNGQVIGTITFSGAERTTTRFDVVPSLLQEGDNTLTYTWLSGVSVLDTTFITYTRRYVAENDQLLCPTGRQNNLAISGFSNSDVRVFDVSDPARAFAVRARVRVEANGYGVAINGPLRHRTLLAVAIYQTPAAVTANEPSNWAATNNRADFLIIAHKDFRAAVEPLAWQRRGQGLRTEIVTLEDVYDEWGGGTKSLAALRAFLAYTQTNWAVAPRYVLLAGDASIDPRNYLGPGDFDFVPTTYIATAFIDTASDAGLADFNNDGTEDFALGRLPVRTAAEAAQVVGKITRHQLAATSLPSLLLVTDHANDNDFELAHNDLLNLLPGAANVRDIRRLGQTDAAMRAQVLSQIQGGPDIVQYTGHGFVQGWANAGFLTVADAPNLYSNNAPIVLTMACLNGYFHDISTPSLAEALLSAPNGGAVAVWASSALTYSVGQTPMDQEWFRQIYLNNSAPRLGEAIRLSKAATYDHDVRRTWTLFGDPTMPVK